MNTCRAPSAAIASLCYVALLLFIGGMCTVAVADGVNTMASAFGRPVPGLHGYRSSKQVFEPVPSVSNATYSHQRR